MERLIRLAGKTSAEEVALGDGLVLGRGEEAGLRLFDETASRRHAVLRREDGRLVLEDQGSANGTRVNGVRTARAVLCDGDEIGIGDVRLRFLVGAATDRPTKVVDPHGAAEDDGRVEATVDPAEADPAAGGGPAALARMRLLLRAAEIAAEATDADRLAVGVLDLLVDAFSPDRAAIHLGAPGALRVAADHPRGTATPPASRTLARRVLERGEAVLVADGHAAGREGAAGPESAASLVGRPWRSTMAAPLVTVEGVRGMLLLEAREAGRYDADDLAVLAAVGRQTALALRTTTALSSARAEARRLGTARPPADVEILGDAPAVRRLLELVEKAAPSDATILVTGETGTGKELVARRLHARSPRRAAPFVALNAAALVEGLLESELFGHERGAFTGADARRDGRIAEAGAGTLFLDEVGELSPALQAKLLRVLSDRTFTRLGGRDVLRMDCRLVVATHRDLPAMVREGRFREDLWYRLAVVTLECPPLRERGSDVERLAEIFLERAAATLGRRVPTLSADARARLRAHRWPGNVRELGNVLQRALILSAGDVLTADDLPREVGPPAPPASSATAGAPTETAPLLTVHEAEKRAVLAALAHTKGRKGEAAALLGISWPTLNRKLREYGME